MSTSFLRKRDLDPNPIRQLEHWLNDAQNAGIAEPRAMTLATASRDGHPSARMVLLRGVDERGLVWYTNHGSQKAQELAENPYAAVVLYWDTLRRQVRVTGQVSQVSRTESEAYFATRPVGHRLSAWASDQSQPIADRDTLEAQLRAVTERLGESDVPLPPFWGGYRLTPDRFEFWQNGLNRLHDRFRYTPAEAGGWVIQRLSP